MLSFNKKNTGRFVGAFEILSKPARRRLESCDHRATPLQLFGRERDTRTLQHHGEFLLGWLTSVICHGSSPPTFANNPDTPLNHACRSRRACPSRDDP